MQPATVSALSDDELIEEVDSLRARERDNTARLIAHLVEVEGRRLHLKLGFPSLYGYLTDKLGYPEDAAYKRQRVTGLARDFPVIIDHLASGALHLSGALVLAPHLTQSNCEELLAASRGRSKRDIAKIVAERAPRPAVPPSIRKRPTPTVSSSPGSQPSLLAQPGPASAPARPELPPRGETPPTPATPTSSNRRTTPPQPLGPGRYKVTFTASQNLVDKIERLQALLSHQVPSGDLAGAFERALDVAIETFEKRRFGVGRGRKSRSPRQREVTKPGRHIAANVRREVFERDKGRCTYVGEGGRRCGSTHRIQLDHLVPFARGGPHTVDNLALRCQAHNLLAAVEAFGPDKVPPFALSGASP